MKHGTGDNFAKTKTQREDNDEHRQSAGVRSQEKSKCSTLDQLTPVPLWFVFISEYNEVCKIFIYGSVSYIVMHGKISEVYTWV